MHYKTRAFEQTKAEYTKRIKMYQEKYQSNPSYHKLYQFMIDVQGFIYQINFSIEMIRDFKELVRGNRSHFRNMLQLGNEKERHADDLEQMKGEFASFIHRTQNKTTKLNQTFLNTIERSQNLWAYASAKIHKMRVDSYAQMRRIENIIDTNTYTHVAESTHVRASEIEIIPKEEPQMQIIPEEEPQMEIIREAEKEIEIMPEGVEEIEIIPWEGLEETDEENSNVLEILDDEGKLIKQGDLIEDDEWEGMLEMHEEMQVWQRLI